MKKWISLLFILVLLLAPAWVPQAEGKTKCGNFGCEPVIRAWGTSMFKCSEYGNEVYIMWPGRGQSVFTFRFEASGGGTVTTATDEFTYITTQIPEDNISRWYEVEMPVGGLGEYDLHVFSEAANCNTKKGGLGLTQIVKEVQILER